jgi:hypothetical protein
MWAKRYGYTDWKAQEAFFPPSFRPYLQSVHYIRKGAKEPPRQPLMTWDNEVAAREQLEGDASTPLQSPEGIRTTLKRPRDPADATLANQQQQPPPPPPPTVNPFAQAHYQTPTATLRALR